MDRFTVRPATEPDLTSVVGVQRRAFTRVAAQLSIPAHRLPPLSEQLDDVLTLYASGTRFFVAVDALGAVIGSVRASEHDGLVEIGRLVVDDGWERRGVATALMDLLEASYPAARCFELFTGHDAVAALTLYEARGYVVCRRQALDGVQLVWLQKWASGAL